MDRKNAKAIGKRQLGGEDDQENLLQQTLLLIEKLFQARLIERIVRPIDKQVRQKYIEEFGKKLQVLHQKLQRIHSQIIEMNYNDNNPRNKSVFGQITSKPSDFRKVIRSIESKYTQVMVQGSFKFFKKIAMALGLKYTRNMDIINIQEWASHCLDTKPNDLCC